MDIPWVYEIWSGYFPMIRWMMPPWLSWLTTKLSQIYGKYICSFFWQLQTTVGTGGYMGLSHCGIELGSCWMCWMFERSFEVLVKTSTITGYGDQPHGPTSWGGMTAAKQLGVHEHAVSCGVNGFSNRERRELRLLRHNAITSITRYQYVEICSEQIEVCMGLPLVIIHFKRISPLWKPLILDDFGLPEIKRKAQYMMCLGMKKNPMFHRV